MVDIHQHIVYGFDDGARDWAETVRLLKSAEAQGVSSIIATSHATPGLERFDYAGYISKVNAINKYAHDEGIGVRLYPGAEILYTPSTVDELEAKRIPTLCFSSAVLVEFYPDESYNTIFEAFRKLANSGYTPVLAHVERYERLIGRLDYIAELRDRLDALIQMNCRTVIKPGGFTFSRFCGKLIKEGLIDFVASDAHSSDMRPIKMSEAYQTLAGRYGADIADRLTSDNQMNVFERLRR